MEVARGEQAEVTSWPSLHLQPAIELYDFDPMDPDDVTYAPHDLDFVSPQLETRWTRVTGLDFSSMNRLMRTPFGMVSSTTCGCSGAGGRDSEHHRQGSAEVRSLGLLGMRVVYNYPVEIQSIGLLSWRILASL